MVSKNISWEEFYNMLEAENPTITEVKATVPDEHSDSDSPLKELENIFSIGLQLEKIYFHTMI